MDNGSKKRKRVLGKKKLKNDDGIGDGSLNIYRIETGITRKVISSTGEIKNITLSDAKTQTSLNYNSGPNNDEDGWTASQDIAKIENCPICLEKFNEERRLMISNKCGHSYCSQCFEKIFKHELKRDCPICRLSCKRDEFVTVKFYHLETLTSFERSKTIDALEILKNANFTKLNNWIKALEEGESEQGSIPVICHKNSLKKRRLDFVDCIDSRLRLKRFDKMRIEIVEAISIIEKILGELERPSLNSVFDISKFLIDELIDRIKKSPTRLNLTRPNLTRFSSTQSDPIPGPSTSH